MTKRVQIIFSFLAVLVGIAFFSFLMPEAFSQTTPAATMPRGPFMITPAGDDRNTVWRVDQSSGRVSYCVRNVTSVDPALIASRAPFCSAWSE